MIQKKNRERRIGPEKDPRGKKELKYLVRTLKCRLWRRTAKKEKEKGRWKEETFKEESGGKRKHRQSD